MDMLLTITIATIIAVFFLFRYIRDQKKTEAASRESQEKGKLHSTGPQAQFPLIDMTYCIGCASCTIVCPEGDVLAMLGGKAVMVNGHKCIGHSLCAEACPVGAITMVTAAGGTSADMPYLTSEHETTTPNVFIVGELAGLALIKNAINQGRDCIDLVTARIAGVATPVRGVYDVLIVGAGPAGISAALRAIENKLNYMVIEQDEEIGGTVAKYPRQKLVMTSPVQFPTYGTFKKRELSKEDLIAFWQKVMDRADFKARTGEKVQDIKKGEDGLFTVVTTKDQHRARVVILALGKTGSPRKLGVKGEELPKVMYRLIEADHYVNNQILVVGGGDSAVEAAMGLGHQVGNKVTLSYRKDAFSRIKERNTQRIQECMRAGTVKVVFNSAPVEIKEKTVIFEVKGNIEEIPNDFVWVFAGGEPPTAFLKKIGIGFGLQDLTAQASNEAKMAAQANQELAKSGTTKSVTAEARDEPSKGEPAKSELTNDKPGSSAGHRADVTAQASNEAKMAAQGTQEVAKSGRSKKESVSGEVSRDEVFKKDPTKPQLTNDKPGFSAGHGESEPSPSRAGETRFPHQPIDAATHTRRNILIPAAADLAHRIVDISLRNAEALRSSIQDRNDEAREQRWFLVVCEFLYFFMHLTKRFSDKELGQKQRRELLDELRPLVIISTVERVFTDCSIELKRHLATDTIKNSYYAEIAYLVCENKNSLFSKLAERVAEQLGGRKNPSVVHDGTFTKTMSLALVAFNELNFPGTVRAIGSDNS